MSGKFRPRVGEGLCIVLGNRKMHGFANQMLIFAVKSRETRQMQTCVFARLQQVTKELPEPCSMHFSDRNHLFSQ